MKVLVATNNKAKIERYRMLLRGTDIELLSPSELGVESVDVAETAETLGENALLKARAYFGKTDLPILANDTGFWVEGEGFVTAPKRITLNGRDEASMTQEELADTMREFWRGVAHKHGGEADAAFLETFALISPDGAERTADVRRDITLTDKDFGPAHIQFPMRSLYISKTTGKPAVDHTQEEEDAELAPVRNALASLLLP